MRVGDVRLVEAPAAWFFYPANWLNRRLHPARSGRVPEDMHAGVPPFLFVPKRGQSGPGSEGIS